VIIFTFSSLAGVVRALLQGLNRFDLLASLNIVTFIIFAVMSLGFLYLGWGLTGLVVAMIGMFVLQMIGGLLMVTRLCPFLRVNSRFIFSRQVWSYLLNFGIQIQISYLADIFKTQVPKFLAAAFIGPAAAGYYDLGNRIANVGWSIPAALLPAIIPAASTAAASKDLPRLQDLFVKGTRYLLIVVLPIGAALALFSGKIFQAWLGNGYQDAAFVLLCLALGNIFHLSTGVGTFIGRGIARPATEVRYQLLTLFLYLLLGFSLYKLIGFRGIPLGVAFASVIGALYFLASFSRVVSVKLRVFVLAVIAIPFTAVLPALLVSVTGFYLLISQVSPLFLILVLGSLFGLVYMSIAGIFLIRTDRNLPITLLVTMRDMLGLRRE
jgi:O-antigen/teichoic acid export membrane protein